VTVVGWREWVALPELGVPALKVKVDTGARSSSLHAFDVEEFDREGRRWLRFTIHPFQRDEQAAVVAEAALVEHRDVRSSNGDTERRPVIRTDLAIVGVRFGVELTLSRRDEMGFRMLLGRSAIRRRFLVDAARSYIGGGTTLTPP
jgi:hypothetical protein